MYILGTPTRFPLFSYKMLHLWLLSTAISTILSTSSPLFIPSAFSSSLSLLSLWWLSPFFSLLCSFSFSFSTWRSCFFSLYSLPWLTWISYHSVAIVYVDVSFIFPWISWLTSFPSFHWVSDTFSTIPPSLDCLVFCSFSSNFGHAFASLCCFFPLSFLFFAFTLYAPDYFSLVPMMSMGGGFYLCKRPEVISAIGRYI